MEIEWKISDDDVARIKALLDDQKNNALVKVRIEKNLANKKPEVDKQEFWLRMVSMRLTSVQRSGPNSPVGQFVRKDPFPLTYAAVTGAQDPEIFMATVLKEAGGIRHSPTIAEQLAANLALLESGEWERTLRQCKRLTSSVSQAVETEVAEYIQDKFAGFGPKQSRNLLQVLRLTRYEIPIDSRIIGWLNEFGFPVRLSATALADSNYYDFVSDGIRKLCAACEVYPCVLDAAIFALKDGDAWTEENAIY